MLNPARDLERERGFEPIPTTTNAAVVNARFTRMPAHAGLKGPRNTRAPAVAESRSRRAVIRRASFKKGRQPVSRDSEVERSETELERHARRHPARDIQKGRQPVSRDCEVERSETELERETGFEPATSTLARSRSTK